MATAPGEIGRVQGWLAVLSGDGCNVNNKRFTKNGSPELEKRLADTCGRIVSEILTLLSRARLEALVLGGGYGRGEGGVLRTEAGDRPYNDLEFYVFVRGNVLFSEFRYRGALEELGKRLSQDA